MEHILQRARHRLGYYRSQKYWQDDLREYRESRYDAIRAFSFNDMSFLKREDVYPYPYEDRKKEWSYFWPEHLDNSDSFSYAETGTYRYIYQNLKNGEVDTVSVKFDSDHVPGIQLDISDKGCRVPIVISLDELLASAKEMMEICPGDPCYEIFKSNILKEIAGSSVGVCTELTIREVVNIVGMVGAGKSTLIKILAFWCNKNGYRIIIVADTVAEVLNLQKYLYALGVVCSPLIGRNERLKYINQISQPNETCLHVGFSQYLTPVCLIDGMDEQHDEAITFGKEPCYSLKKNGKNFLCPYFDQCPGTKMLRECYTAPVVLTTVAGIAASRVGHVRETFWSWQCVILI